MQKRHPELMDPEKAARIAEMAQDPQRGSLYAKRCVAKSARRQVTRRYFLRLSFRRMAPASLFGVRAGARGRTSRGREGGIPARLVVQFTVTLADILGLTGVRVFWPQQRPDDLGRDFRQG